MLWARSESVAKITAEHRRSRSWRHRGRILPTGEDCGSAASKSWALDYPAEPLASDEFLASLHGLASLVPQI